MTNSIPQPKPTFKSWLHTLRTHYGVIMPQDKALYYYNGGYSPKSVFGTIFNYPVNADIKVVKGLLIVNDSNY